MKRQELARLIYVALISFAVGAGVFAFFTEKVNCSLQIRLFALVVTPTLVVGILEVGRWLERPESKEGEQPE